MSLLPSFPPPFLQLPELPECQYSQQVQPEAGDLGQTGCSCSWGSLINTEKKFNTPVTGGCPHLYSHGLDRQPTVQFSADSNRS